MRRQLKTICLFLGISFILCQNINPPTPIIKEFTNRKAKVILISHLGRPKGKVDEKLSLKPIAPILENLLNSKVYFSNESCGSTVIEKSKKIKSGEVLLLENIRFNKEEETNEEAFAKELSKVGDIYVNEAFSCSHKTHASDVMVKCFPPSGTLNCRASNRPALDSDRSTPDRTRK